MVQGADLSLGGVPPSGQAYQPLQNGEFRVICAPQNDWNEPGQPDYIGDRSCLLTGQGSDPPLPYPFLSCRFPAQQGLAILRFDGPPMNGVGR
jgi:hypothetical protein